MNRQITCVRMLNTGICLTLEILMQRVCGGGDLGTGILLNSLDESRTNS